MTVDGGRESETSHAPDEQGEREGETGHAPEENGERDGVPDEVRGGVDDEVIAEYEESVPDWDDEYFDRVSDRLMFNYDLSKDERVRGETWPLFGKMRIESQKQFLHRSINFANHHMEEYLFARRVPSARRDELERLVDLADELAQEWITMDEEHKGTEFTFVLVAPEIPDDVRRMVESFSERTLLKFGYYGHYEVNLVVVAPEEGDAVASKNTDVDRAFALWRTPGAETESAGLLARLTRAFRR